MKPILNGLRRIAAFWQRVIHLPYLGRGGFALLLLVLLLSITQDWHLSHPDEDVDEAIELARQSNQSVPWSIQRLTRVMPYLNLWVTLGSVLLVLIIFRRWNQPSRLMLPLLVAAGSLTVWAVGGELVGYIVHSQMTDFGEPAVPLAFLGKQMLIAASLLSVPGALWWWMGLGILEKHTLRCFIHPLVFCFTAFCSLYIIADLLDNMKDFQDAKSRLSDVLGFYVGLLPYIFVTVVPVALLLAVLYSLTRMSRANELISMLGTGRSLARVLRPIFLASAYTVALAAAANYYWAPRAEGNRKNAARQGRSVMAEQIMYRNEQTRRTWFVGSFPFSLQGGRERMRGIQMREENLNGAPARTILAPTATWTPRGGWRFYDGREIRYEKGTATAMPPFPTAKSGQQVLEVPHLAETPWSLVSHALKADFMGVPELLSYLKAHPQASEEKLAPFRTHLWHRFALPWQALAVVLFAVPLGVAYSRRGALGGIAGSIFIFFVFMFVNNLFLNLGKGGHLPPWFTVWVPHLLFGTLGLIFFYFRSRNRDLPRLRLWPKKAAQVARPRRRGPSAPVAAAT
ncbi:MAG: LptF/LptG family permease [Verrucomicrobiaceae bacterium]|nr:LptF/LptG family permease [Verrucomicrobiaceae bacterium]